MPLFRGQNPSWRESLYYAYYELGEHAVPQHFGVRTAKHKLIYFPNSREWNLFDLERDPQEMTSVHAEARYQDLRKQLEKELERLRKAYDAPPYPKRAG